MPTFLLTIIIDNQAQSKIVTQYIRTLILTSRTRFAYPFLSSTTNAKWKL